MVSRRLTLRLQFSLIIMSVIVALASGCGSFLYSNSAQSTSSDSSLSNVIQAEILFKVSVIPPMTKGDKIVLDILDEITGLALNPSRYQMEDKGDHFELKVPVTVGSVVKYRYLRQGTPSAVEYTSAGNQVRYRLYSVSGANEINDKIAAWNDMPYQGKTGRVSGKIIGDLRPGDLADALVDVAGINTISSADGSFFLDKLPVGTHMMVVYSLHGSFMPFQQEVRIEDQSETRAEVNVVPSRLVNVTFLVSVPENTPENAPLRLIGNVYSLGNTFADLGGGISTLASRAPSLAYLGNRKYTISMQLPSGLDLRYKYSLGDGFWNAEHQQDGQFNTRQLIVPAKDVILEDTVVTWQMSEKSPVQFNLTINEKMFPNERPSIQFNPYGWLEPLPMWPQDTEMQWSYTLFSPLDILNQVSYRYCRNEQCDIAFDASVSSGDPQGTFTVENAPAEGFNDVITNWAFTNKPDSPTPVLKAQITPRDDNFAAGVQLSSGYHPSWQTHLNSAFYYIHGMAGNQVILSPEWTFTSVNLPVLEAVPGRNQLYADLKGSIAMATEQELSVALFPQMEFSTTVEEFWSAGTKDGGWWQSWYDRYETFIIHNARLAEDSNAHALILGGNQILPALPNGILADGTPSLSPENAEKRWIDIIAKARGIYSGKIYWALPYPAGIEFVPEFIKDVDGIYILWSADLDTEERSQANMAEKFLDHLDQDIQPIYQSSKKPFWIGVNFPTTSNALEGCKLIFGCTYEHLESPDLLMQSDLYNAAFYAVSQRDWVTGIISQDFYPPVALIDQSPSIFQKPAADVAWYWFNMLLGQANP